MPSLTVLRAHAREIFSAGLASVDPLVAIKNQVQLQKHRLHVADRSYDLAQTRRIIVAGCGKAAARMALAMEEVLGENISAGIVVVKYGHELPLEKIKVIEAGHPIPDQAGVEGARRIMELLDTAGEHDLVFFLISGGGSALLAAPAEGLSLADKQQTTEILLKSGATIKEVNAVRKHLSCVKGGRCAQLAAPANLVSLILSDVVGDALEAVASGPTVADTSTYDDCLRILRRYNLRARVPRAVLEHLERGANGEIEETPKPFNPFFQKGQNVVVGNNRMALNAASRRAEELGYHSMILSDSVEGESRAVAVSFSRRLIEIARTNASVSRPACVLSGGETTVTVCGNGLGGRNQEFALTAAIELDGFDGAVVLSAGTDGADGPTDAAGGIVDGLTIERGRAKGFAPREFLARNDSYHFLQATNDLLITGPTLTNVMDLQVALLA